MSDMMFDRTDFMNSRGCNINVKMIGQKTKVVQFST